MELITHANDSGSVRVAEYYLGAHVNQLIYKEQSALKHLLVYEHTSLGFCGHYKHNAQKVRREPWPRCVCNGHNGTVNIRLNFEALLAWYVYVISVHFKLYAKFAETIRNQPQILYGYIIYCQVRASHCCHAYKTANLNHVWQNGVATAFKLFNAVYCKQVRTYALYIGAH